MNIGKLTKLVDDQIDKDENKVVIKFYDVIMNTETTTDELNEATYLMSTRLENLGYKVYRTNQEYTYNSKKYIVQTNEVLVGIKK